MSRSIKIIIGLIIFLVISIMGVSFAFYMVTINGESDDIVIKSGNLSLTLEDSDTITMNNARPGASASKEFTVTNNSNNVLVYNIKLVDVVNTFIDKNDPVYSLVGNNGINKKEEIITSSDNEYLMTKIAIDPKDTHTYTLTITFKETNDNQNDNMGVSFSGRINIDDEEIFIPVTPVELLNNLYFDSNPELVVDDFDNIRYIGADPANYIYFNCDDYNNPSDSTCEKWRIIGSFKDIEDSEGNVAERVKIMRDKSIGNMPWNSNNSTNWATASLNTYLNGEYYNSLKNDTTKNIIDSVVWNLGGLNRYYDTLVDQWYSSERGSTVYSSNPITWTGRIGLIYPSDYGYATSGGNTTSRDVCLSKAIFYWNSSNVSDCYNNNYIYEANIHQWTLTHFTYFQIDYDFYYSFSIGSYVYDNQVVNLLSIRPVFYLLSNIKINSGDGSEANPYTLSI